MTAKQSRRSRAVELLGVPVIFHPTAPVPVPLIAALAYLMARRHAHGAPLKL
jgi:hypothetical protein